MITKRLITLLAATALFAGACVLEPLQDDPAGSRPVPDVTLEQSDQAPPPSDLADIIERVLPSVVNVRVRAIQPGALGSQEAEGQGSGVIIDENGIIVTNNHVVQCAVDVTVVLNNGDRVEGRVVGTTPEKDLAVVRIDADGLDAIELGNSKDLRLGDEVLALGFPLGLGGPTVTSGIVSGKGRSIEPQGGPPLEDLLQTDAAINPGNSGGALVDRAGRLVGINTAAAGAGAAENIGFAIPIDTAVPIVEDILQGDRPWLGVQTQSIESAAIAAQLGLDPDVRGALVAGLLEGPAEAAGLEEGHVIVGIDGHDVRSGEDLTDALADLSAGERVSVGVITPDGERTIEVELGERPPPQELYPEICG